MKKLIIFSAVSVILLLSACQKGPGDADKIPVVCAVPESTSGEEISYSDLVESGSPYTYALRGIALGVDGKSSLAQDIFIAGDNKVSFSSLRCKAGDGGTNGFRLTDVDPNLSIPTSFGADDGRFTGILDLYFRGDGNADAQLSQSISESLIGGWLEKLRGGGANVRIFRDGDDIYLMIERTDSQPYIYRMKIFYQRI